MSIQHPEPEVERVWGLFLVLIVVSGIIAFLRFGCVNTRLTDSYSQTIDTVAQEIDTNHEVTQQAMSMFTEEEQEALILAVT